MLLLCKGELSVVSLKVSVGTFMFLNSLCCPLQVNIRKFSDTGGLEQRLKAQFTWNVVKADFNFLAIHLRDVPQVLEVSLEMIS